MLLAQATLGAAGWSVGWIVGFVALCGGGVFLFVVTLLGFRQARIGRQLQHEERMKAIEAGQPLDPVDLSSKFMHNTFWIAFWIVFGVPGAGFYAVSTAMQTANLSLAVSIVAWLSAAAASIAAVVCATVLMLHARSSEVRSGKPGI